MNERKILAQELAVIAVLFFAGCVAGKLVMENAADTWIAFNGPAIGI